MSTYTAHEASERQGREEGRVYRVTYGWSNYEDFATLEEALTAVMTWQRPSDWKESYLSDADTVLKTDEHDWNEEHTISTYKVIVPEEIGRAMREAHQAALAQMEEDR